MPWSLREGALNILLCEHLRWDVTPERSSPILGIRITPPTLSRLAPVFTLVVIFFIALEESMCCLLDCLLNLSLIKSCEFKVESPCGLCREFFFPSFPFFFSFIFISWRLITLQYCSGFCHTLTWISHGFTCIPHPDPLSHLPLYLIPLGLPSAPGASTCLMHPTWAGDLYRYQYR